MVWNIKGTVIENAKMSKYTSMRVGGPVRYLIYPSDFQDLIEVLKILNGEGIEWRILGNGTNVIVSDKGLQGAIIRLTRIRRLSIRRNGDNIKVFVSSGYQLKDLILKMASLNLSGIERLYSIPGTVGGAIKMNAGSFGVSISDAIVSVTCMSASGEIFKLSKRNLNFSYRYSSIPSKTLIIEAEISLKYGDRQRIIGVIDEVLTERIKRHPMDMPSSGSIFKAVRGIPAWTYIEKANLKGLRVGDACVSTKHANFIVNLGRAKAYEVKSLIEKIKKEVYEKEGVELEEEVEFWGFDD